MDMTNLSQPALLPPFQSLSISPTTTILDFGRDFAVGKTPEEIASIVNDALKSFDRSKIKSFSLFFSPFFSMFLPDVENWIAFAVSRGVEELNLDFSMGAPPWYEDSDMEDYVMKLPLSLYSCESLTHLSLRHTDFRPPAGFHGFDRLRFLSLRQTKIGEDALQSILSKCPLLISLSLRDIYALESIKVFSPELQLERLEIVSCPNTWEFKILAPKLKSFVFYGGLYFDEDSFADISSLEDAFVNSIDLEAYEPEDDYEKLISDLSHVKILTVCTMTLRPFGCFKNIAADNLTVKLPNLRELQILIESISSYFLDCLYSFLWFCEAPLLEKLFIQLSAVPEGTGYNNIDDLQEPSGVLFDQLKLIKLSNFEGGNNEMRLVKFLLERATVLEKMVIVTPPEAVLKEDVNSKLGQLSLLPKASPQATIVLCGRSPEDDVKAPTPTHKEFYCEF